MDQELLQITATNVIFDLFLMYGLEAFNVEQKDKEAENENDGKFTYFQRLKRSVAFHLLIFFNNYNIETSKQNR